MSINEPDVADSARIPIGKAAKLLGINRTTLLKHTMQGLIKCGFCAYQGKELLSPYCQSSVKMLLKSYC